MGISGLTKVIADNAPAAMKNNEIKNYFGRKVAIDASMSLYQFLIAVRSDGQMLQSETGETTSHLMGFFYRTIRMVDNGIKPVYVFDGKPPTLKSGERKERREDEEWPLTRYGHVDDKESYDKFNRRIVKVTREHNDEVKRLLRLMGMPYVEAPCEAEAQCAALAKAGKVYAAATEDMDTLTFGAPILLRHLTFSEARKMPINEIHLDKVLAGLEMTMAQASATGSMCASAMLISMWWWARGQFVDLCILLGCDYCESVRGIGPYRALSLLREYKSLDALLKQLDKKKYTVPEGWPVDEVRELFLNPNVLDPATVELKWNDPDVEGLISFMVTEKGFNEDRIRGGIEKLQKGRTASTQGRLDSFFKPSGIVSSSATATKRKTEEKPATKAKRGRSNGGGGGGKPRR
ncbi:flap endonuclease 1-like protein [Syncephalis pseudoplumigaleata]|uniref:Flap endonuclease 1 n=1 Tax=Syncephalis pseudoplumigaleata TaxID=1712513 RepID=A0A4P9Z8U2_9FUNG|nr:flap endonuclease 1-like protein [Syncephalis pseudoplumigaleata]|eukprot:RKP28170.1 flap endonuclease 1-like protein [Syncephalis pseudoplumigaleata]